MLVIIIINFNFKEIFMFNRYIRQFFLFFIVGLVIVACDNDSNPIAGSLEDGLVISGNNTTVAMISIESHADHDSDHDEAEHADPIGFELVEDGASSYAYRQLDLTPDGSISINVGETKEFTVHFLDCENLDQNDCLLLSDCEWDSDENACHETGHVHCDELDQSACDLSDHCEWHTDDNACEEEGHEHCDELDQSACDLSDHCEWHSDDNACEEEGHEHCDELDQSACDLSDHCEWHSDDNACEEEEHGMHIEITGVSQGSTTFQIQLMHDGHSDYTSLEIPVVVSDAVMFSCNTNKLCLKKCCSQTIYAAK